MGGITTRTLAMDAGFGQGETAPVGRSASQALESGMAEREEEVRARFRSIRRAQMHGNRAPHKPLLLLMALAAVCRASWCGPLAPLR